MKPEHPHTRILLVDDHEVVRRGLRTLLEAQPGFEVCGEAGDGAEGVRQALALEPDVVVLDISMPEMDGVEAARQIIGQVPRAEVLMLSMHDADHIVCAVVAAGARGYMLKSDAGRDLVAAVESLRAGKAFFSLKLGRERTARSPALSRGEPVTGRLTPRELEVTQLLTVGKSNKQAADVLGISVKTVETHRARVMRKLGFASFAELVRWAIRHEHIAC